MWIGYLRPGLYRESFRWILPNGTFPIAASNEPSGSWVSAKLSLRICACGYSAAATCAVTGSSSIPAIAVPSGASPMKFPDPQPGSRTRPPLNPNAASPLHIARASAVPV